MPLLASLLLLLLLSGGGLDWTPLVDHCVLHVCSEKASDPLAITCSHGGDVVIWHNYLQDFVAPLFRRAHLGVSVESWWF